LKRSHAENGNNKNNSYKWFTIFVQREVGTLKTKKKESDIYKSMVLDQMELFQQQICTWLRDTIW
jgi:hypothetical protein